MLPPDTGTSGVNVRDGRRWPHHSVQAADLPNLVMKQTLMWLCSPTTESTQGHSESQPLAATAWKERGRVLSLKAQGGLQGSLTNSGTQSGHKGGSEINTYSLKAVCGR